MADAIREKTGGTDKLSPTDMITAIEGISAGGGDIDALIDGSITEITSNVESVRAMTFNICTSLKSVNFPKAVSVGNNPFVGCTSLKNANFPALKNVPVATFGLASIEIVNLPSAETLSGNVFGDSSIAEIQLPSLTSVSGGYTFHKCIKLSKADFPSLTNITNCMFQGCDKLKTLILRNSAVCTLENTSAFNRTAISNGTGYIYVPSALVDSYKAATNWSTFADQFRALEDYTVDGTITGELDETKI